MLGKLLNKLSLLCARLILPRSRRRCCYCVHYRPSDGVCGIYFINRGSVFNIKTSPWFDCLLESLRDQIQVADLDVLHASAELGRQRDAKNKEGEEDGLEEDPT